MKILFDAGLYARQVVKKTQKQPQQTSHNNKMLNTKSSSSIQHRHRGWSSTYMESGDAWPPCWISKSSSSSSATNGANGSADDQTIGTTFSSQTAKRSNVVSFQKMQQQQPPAAAGAAATKPYASIFDFVAAHPFPAMLSDHRWVILSVRMFVQGVQEDVH
jgi:hypothetical protein